MKSPNVLKPLTNSLTAVFRPINVPIIRICGLEENAPSILSNIINSPMQCVLPSEEEKKRATNGQDPEEYIVPPIGLKPFNQLCDSQKRKRLAIIRAEINKLNSWLKSRYAMEIKGIDLVAYDPNVPRKNFKINFVDEWSRKRIDLNLLVSLFYSLSQLNTLLNSDWFNIK